MVSPSCQLTNDRLRRNRLHQWCSRTKVAGGKAAARLRVNPKPLPTWSRTADWRPCMAAAQWRRQQAPCMHAPWLQVGAGSAAGAPRWCAGKSSRWQGSTSAGRAAVGGLGREW